MIFAERTATKANVEALGRDSRALGENILDRVAPLRPDHDDARWPRLVRILIIVPASTALWATLLYLLA